MASTARGWTLPTRALDTSRVRSSATESPSFPQRTYTGRLPPGGIVKQVGFPGDGKPFVEVNYDATMRRHGSDGIYDPGNSTDNAPGQAHAASGARFGNPQVRPAARPPSGTKREDTGALDRASYLGPKK